MKRIAYFLTMALVLPLFAACSDDTEEVLEPEVQKIVKGTDTRDNDDCPYYWVGNQKMYFEYLDNETFIYFNISDKDVVFEKLAEKGIELERTDCKPLMPSDSDRFSNRGEKFNYLSECIWTEVKTNYKEVIDIPEILDACPSIYLENWGKCSGTSIIYVFETSPAIIQKIAEEYNTYIFGTDDYIGISYIICDKYSKGNALEIAKDIAEKKIAEAEPAMAGTATTDV